MSTSESPGQNDDALMSHLKVIEEQPLAERASAYNSLYEQLRTQLEGSDIQRGQS